MKTPDNPKVFSYEYYERIYMVEESHWWSIGIREICRQLLSSTNRFNRNTKVIDIGCGTGISGKWLKGAGLAGSVVQSDIALHGVSFCKTRGNSKVLVSSAAYLPFKDEHFDLAISMDVVQHININDLKRSFAEAFRVIKPGGTYIIRTNVFRHGDEPEDTTSYRRFKWDELRDLTKEAGFSLERQTYANAIPAILSYLPIPALKRRLPGGKGPKDQGLHLTPTDKTQMKDLIQSWILKLEALLIGRVNIPLGHTMILMARKDI